MLNDESIFRKLRIAHVLVSKGADQVFFESIRSERHQADGRHLMKA
jgi:hypothetical protein